MNCDSDEKKRCEVRIVKQPKSRISFVKASAVPENSRSITNREDDGCVKIIAVVNDYFLGNLKVLVTTAVQREEDGVYIPSRYVVQNCGISEENINNDLFKGDFKVREGAAHQFEYEMEKAFIFAPYEKENLKYPHLEKAAVLEKNLRAYLELKGIAKTDHEIRKLCRESCDKKYAKKTCLAFDVYTEHPVTGTRYFVTDTIYSDTIYDGKQKFVVKKLCNTHVSSAGNSEMVLLLSEVKDVKVKFIGPNKEIIDDIPISETYNEHSAIVVRPPQIMFDTNQAVMPYHLTVENLAGDVTKMVKFYYVNEEYELNEAKRKRAGQSLY